MTRDELVDVIEQAILDVHAEHDAHGFAGPVAPGDVARAIVDVFQLELTDIADVGPYIETIRVAGGVL